MGSPRSSDRKAADAASSILQELGVRSTNKQKSGVVAESDKHKKQPIYSLEERALGNGAVPPETGKPSHPTDGAFRRILLKLSYAALAGLFCFIILLLTGGYLKVLDRSLFQQLTLLRYHQLEFSGNLYSRLVQNSFNREPLVVLEGGLRNLFGTDDKVGQVRLKALAYDKENRLLESQITFAGILLSEEELKGLSRSEIQRLFEQNHGRDAPNEGLFWNQELPFQTVFFSTGKKAAHTTVQIVSYLRKGEMVYVRTPDRES